MSTNVGTIDRIFRGTLGIVLIYLAFFSGISFFDATLYRYGAAVIGVIMLVTSTLKLCPIYSLLGLKTCNQC